ncbi:MAG TPA: glycosyltransferase family A protein, partial [Candidatus Binatia bacterium]
SPMLAFIIPLKSRRVAKSWQYVTELFERSLKSACNQTSPAFKVIVVSHERPPVEFDHPAVTYIEADFPSPDSSYVPMMWDKYRKLVAGIHLARKLGASHVMEVDADDCVSNRLAELVQRNPGLHGWYFDSGYIYRDGTDRVYLKEKEFHRWCGTCNVVRSDLLNVPENPAGDVSIFSELGHSHLKEKLAATGFPLEALPFPGAVYVNTKHGEGTANQKTLLWHLKVYPKGILHPAKKLFLHWVAATPITESISAEFNLYSIEQRKSPQPKVRPAAQNLSPAKKRQ